MPGKKIPEKEQDTQIKPIIKKEAVLATDEQIDILKQQALNLADNQISDDLPRAKDWVKKSLEVLYSERNKSNIKILSPREVEL